MLEKECDIILGYLNENRPVPAEEIKEIAVKFSNQMTERMLEDVLSILKHNGHIETIKKVVKVSEYDRVRISNAGKHFVLNKTYVDEAAELAKNKQIQRIKNWKERHWLLIAIIAYFAGILSGVSIAYLSNTLLKTK